MAIWEFIRQVLVQMGAKLTQQSAAIYTFLVPAIACAFALLLIFLAVILLQARWRPLRVFISYKNSYQDMAAEIRHFLQQRGRRFKVEMLDFEQRSHDQTVAEVRRMIRTSDMMICIADPAAPSFVNAEILAMSVLNKPIVLIRHQEAQLLPHTALSGYPVLRYDALKKQKLAPLEAYCIFIGRHYSDLRRLGQRLLPGLIILDVFKDLKVYGIVIVLAIAMGVAGWVALKAFVGLILGLTLLFTLAVVALGWWTDFRAVRIARQQMLSGNTTYEQLKEALGDLSSDFSIAECLDRAALPSEHEPVLQPKKR